ncbi:OmpA/MotB family protein [Longibacter sp.]|uniref:OmpA/MotB family protein n=1 Tax=Longibacter sp. TaxID=2045415 RepID=UPI003EB8B3A0
MTSVLRRPFAPHKPYVVLLLAALLVVSAGCSGTPATRDYDTRSDVSAEVERLEDENEALRQDLIDARRRANSGVMRRGETIEVLSTDLYFESGSAQLTSEGVEKLKSVAGTLNREYPDRIVRVEGYTDDQPIGDKLKSKFPSNWELSTGRAAAVVRHLQWTHDISPERFEVVGFGPYQPIATNETADGRRENRRVRIAVLPGSEPDAIGSDRSLDRPSGSPGRPGARKGF